MALLLPDVLGRPFDMANLPVVVAIGSLMLLVGSFVILPFFMPKRLGHSWNQLRGFARFSYASFVKPHTGDHNGGQQGALESFYKAQASAPRFHRPRHPVARANAALAQAEIYDVSRSWLLRGREDMLALAAAQLIFQARRGDLSRRRSIWIDMGGGTGWNIEAMAAYIDVPSFFSEIYLVDLSPSLCAVARQRFARLGWDNVRVVCEDARLFQLEGEKAELITMSYSLSMMPNFHVFVDAAAGLLDAKGIVGVVDFYVQSDVETMGRNYLGGCIQRHVGWIGRTFWRAWFDLDRVGLEGARRVFLFKRNAGVAF